ncbi:MAG TPA: Na+/H+ antiporter subunit G [Acidobacteriota bacterium]
MILEVLIALGIMIGSSFVLIGSIGLVRLGDFYSRLHGPTKATTLGLGSMLLASVLFFSQQGGISLHELLVTAFLFLTAPASAHMLVRAGLHLRVAAITRPPDDLEAFPETAGGPLPEAASGQGERRGTSS